MPTEVEVAHKPKCSFCGKLAEFDFKTQMGQWAYGCKEDYETYRLYENLGTGMGQRLIHIKPA